jgi:hypothetical protein
MISAGCTQADLLVYCQCTTMGMVLGFGLGLLGSLDPSIGTVTVKHAADWGNASLTLTEAPPHSLLRPCCPAGLLQAGTGCADASNTRAL